MQQYHFARCMPLLQRQVQLLVQEPLNYTREHHIAYREKWAQSTIMNLKGLPMNVLTLPRQNFFSKTI
jgi:hypothetical protein